MYKNFPLPMRNTPELCLQESSPPQWENTGQQHQAASHTAQHGPGPLGRHCRRVALHGDAEKFITTHAETDSIKSHLKKKELSYFPHQGFLSIREAETSMCNMNNDGVCVLPPAATAWAASPGPP